MGNVSNSCVNKVQHLIYIVGPYVCGGEKREVSCLLYHEGKLKSAASQGLQRVVF